MKKYRFAINATNVKSAVKAGAAVGVGAVAADVGGRVLRKLSPSIDAFAAQSPGREAAVTLGGGALVSTLLLFIVAKLKPSMAAPVAPFLFGGAVLRAAGPLVESGITSAMEGAANLILPEGKKFPKAGDAVINMSPAGGLWAANGLGGELPRAGGLWAEPARGLGGELPRAGGLYPALMGGGAYIGGELPRAGGRRRARA